MAKMAKDNLFTTDIDKQILWETYLSSFPKGTNPIYKENTYHDCNCCKQFIRDCGAMIAIKEGKIITIWDFEIEGAYQTVANALSKVVKNHEIKNIFKHYGKHLGTNENYKEIETGVQIFEHFSFILPKKHYTTKNNIGTILSNTKTNYNVLARSLKEITLDSAITVLELIVQNSIYRGEEHKKTVKTFINLKIKYDEIKTTKQKKIFCWENSAILKEAGRIKNTVIGTLLIDISNKMDLTKAVKSFEHKVAPTNYKRPTALITKGMIEQAEKKIQELGFLDALERRYAVMEDLTINNILFANKTVKSNLKNNIFDDLKDEVKENIKKFNKVEKVNIKDFIKNIIPKAEKIELFFDNKHENNLMSLIAPKNANAPGIFKWGNNFSWVYNKSVADSMKQRVAKLGGDVTGVLRFSIQWNDGDNNQNDFDAHCIEPNGNLIYYRNKRNPSTSGKLDVDIITPGRKVAVENITWSNIDIMKEGIYTFLVHNFNHCGGMTGFTAEIEYDNKIYSYVYDKNLQQGEKVQVAKIKFSKTKGIEFVDSLKSTIKTKTLWGVNTQKFQNVSMVLNSPNHWDGEKTGNKHYFFILEKCRNEEKARGFFNEFLTEKLTEHRKVFEILGSKMLTKQSERQLSGLGFSSTQKNSIFCKVTGSFTRIIKIIF